MRIAYLASVYDQSVYERLFDPRHKPIQAANKYHTLLCEGFAANGVSVSTLSPLPINRSENRRIAIRVPDAQINGVRFHYLPFVNLPGVKHLLFFLSAFFSLLSAPRDTVLFYDGLVVSASCGACLAAKLRGVKSCCILTDLPDFMAIGGSGMGKRINDFVIRSADCFVFLTEQMNETVNRRSRPYVVSEGHSDVSMRDRARAPRRTDGRRVLLYAGGLETQYGLDALCNAFRRIRKPGEELHLYGSGSYVETLKTLSVEVDGIFYHGVVPASEVVMRELEAELLVNPRSPEGEYTKYSFPSKTMEYMASGVPVVMCRLPGMPGEYGRYVYLFEDGSEEAIAAKLRELLDLPPQELWEKGAAAKRFVMEEKNNIAQAKKILDGLFRAADHIG